MSSAVRLPDSRSTARVIAAMIATGPFDHLIRLR